MADETAKGGDVNRTPRVRVPRQARNGEIVLVRAKLRHPMETGWREDASGRVVPRNRVFRFLCEFNGEEVFRADLHSGVSTDPYLAFDVRASVSGEFTFSWFEDGGKVYTATAAMEVV